MVSTFSIPNIAPNQASSPYLKTMLDAATEHGLRIKPPTSYENGHYFAKKEYEKTVKFHFISAKMVELGSG